MRTINATIRNLVAESELVEKGWDFEQRRIRTQGRISLYLEALKDVQRADDSKDIELLRSRISKVSDEIDVESKQEALANSQRRIESSATDILRGLPFEERYSGSPIYFDLRSLKVGLSLPSRVEPMRDLGSDENYLSIHLSVLLALHRHFNENNRPVPGVIILDQISRPYFPPDKEQDEIEIENDTDRSSLLQYFTRLFHEVDQQNSLQVIVLEHAYFANHERYVKSTLHRWRRDKSGLIPVGWRELT